jgi:predicted acetylornithine/succinylornithine family transaminase
MLAIGDVRSLEARHVAQVYRRVPVVFERGNGVRLYDTDGRAYLDLVSGIGVASLGHANPKLAEAIADQADTLLHTSNVYFHPLQGELASRLAALSGLPRAFFSNSGTEAIETCLKFARRFWHTQGQTDRTGYVALERAFHGRSFGSLSVTWDDHYRAPFAPLVPGVQFVSPDNPSALAAAVTSRTAAVIVEPIQGEGGVRPLSPAFAAALREVCAATGTLLIADEVQSGLGRTGQAFYSQALGLSPDLIAVGKALGGGVPIGAALMSERVAAALAFGDHGSTYGGNLLACRAALVFVGELEGGLIARVAALGTFLEPRLRSLAARNPIVREVRGAGLIWGLQLDRDAAPVIDAALRRGLLVNRTAESVVRLLPALTITEPELEEGLDLLEASFTEVSGAQAPSEIGGSR